MAIDSVATLQLLITVITAGLTGIGWRYRFRPGGHPFVALAGAISLLSAVYVVLLVDPAASGLMLATVTMRDSVLSTIPVLWLVFALEYTGYGKFITKWTVAGLAGVPLTTMVILWLPPLRSVYWGPQTSTITRGVVELGPPFGPWYWVNLGYGYLLMLSGLVLLFGLIVSERRLYTDQSIAIAIGAVVPSVANVFIQIDLNPLPLPLQPLSFSVTGLAFGFALYRSELFSVLPVTRQIGRDAVVEDIQEGVLITDTSDQIVDVNQTGAAIFDQPSSTLIGQSAQTVFGDQAPSDTDGIAPDLYRTTGGRIYEVTVSRIYDRGDRPVGRAVVFRDITDRELRETQLEVLNRVLRHNLRNKLTVVQGYAEMFSNRNSDEEAEYAERQLVATNELLAIGERAREFKELETREETTPQSIDLGAMLRTVIDEAMKPFPEAEVTTEVPSGLTLETYPDVLEIVLENLLRNAAEHTDRPPHITVTVSKTGGAVEVAIQDNGPGIPEDELDVLDAETETALNHGSGLGLWITKWGVQHLGGDLAFKDNEPRGTVAVVTLGQTPTELDGAPFEPSEPR